MQYRIFPSIGVARLGEDDNFFLGPERPGAGPGELQLDGTVTPVVQYKDATRTKIRKQGARFHIFESNDGVNWSPANLPATATVTWTVTLENKKSAVTRPNRPPSSAIRPQVPAGNEPLVIKGGTKQVTGPDVVSTLFKGPYATTASNGTPYNVDVELGRLRTDGQGRLIVLGGKGFTSAPAGEPLGFSFYKNPKWHDDVADGPVTAEIQLSSTAAPIQAEGGAWVIVGPPDYAPAIDCAVTLYDVLRQLGIDEFGLPEPDIPSFDLDIAPILTRVRRLRWVHDDATWSDARLNSPKLRSRAPADQPLRIGVRNLVLMVERAFEGFALRAFQKELLNDWTIGNFDDTPATLGASLSAEGLTRASLEGTAGQGFFPGIEAGIIVLDKELYTNPFDYRINHATVEAGDLTALMAQPWQADFLKCAWEWWPTQRPDLAPQADGTNEEWIRGVTTHKLLVERHGRLGFIVQQGASEVFLEVERDPTLSE
jgi:L-Lysine epsilon oxidase N-terminal/L-lysine epsilon oxidase C-terminal domain